MKKCASCTKDLPDAALHCVFCGAKQAPPPQTAPARTIMGYSGQELDAFRKQSAAGGATGDSGQTAASASPSASQPEVARPGVTPAGPSARAPSASAPTSTGSQSDDGAERLASPAAHGSPGATPPGARSEPAPAPGAQRPSSASLQSRRLAGAVRPGARGGRPIDPWRRSLRVVMLVSGALLLAAFATPLTMNPLVFHWDPILAGAGKANLPALVMAGVGFLGVALAAMPLASGGRGAIAILLGLAGIVAPFAVAGMPTWQVSASTGGVFLLVSGLLVRDAYRDAVLPRVLVTIAAVASLAPWLVPTRSRVPLVELFKGMLDAPGPLTVMSILELAHIALFVLALLAWMPSPSSAGARVIAWLLILWPLFTHAAVLFLLGGPSVIEDSPFTGLLGWVAGAGGTGAGGEAFRATGAGLGVAYLAIIGYGTASVIGKQLE